MTSTGSPDTHRTEYHAPNVHVISYQQKLLQGNLQKNRYNFPIINSSISVALHGPSHWNQSWSHQFKLIDKFDRKRQLLEGVISSSFHVDFQLSLLPFPFSLFDWGLGAHAHVPPVATPKIISFVSCIYPGRKGTQSRVGGWRVTSWSLLACLGSLYDRCLRESLMGRMLTIVSQDPEWGNMARISSSIGTEEEINNFYPSAWGCFVQMWIF